MPVGIAVLVSMQVRVQAQAVQASVLKDALAAFPLPVQNQFLMGTASYAPGTAGTIHADATFA
jgi:hypothetical protein